MTDPQQHSLIEDIQGIGFGICMAAVGMHILTFMGFVAGQTTGVAALIAYGFSLPFPAVYFSVSAPFLWFGWRRMGARFAVKTLITIAALSVLTALLPRWLGFSHIHPAFAALLFGILFGIAALAVVRHGGSFGCGLVRRLGPGNRARAFAVVLCRGGGLQPLSGHQPPPRPLYRNLADQISQ